MSGPLGSLVDILDRMSFWYATFCGVLGYSPKEEGELGELPRSKLSSELVDPDGDSAGVGQRGERDDRKAGVDLGKFLSNLCHGEPCSS